jgi:hypothetical protein
MTYCPARVIRTSVTRIAVHRAIIWVNVACDAQIADPDGQAALVLDPLFVHSLASIHGRHYHPSDRQTG